MNIPETVYAVHNFKAENEDELSFCTGEPIIVLQKDDGFDDGWWKGENVRGEIGLFPMNFISSPPCQLQLPTPSSSSNRDSINSVDKPPISSNQLKRSVIQSLLNPALSLVSPEDWDVNQVELWLISIDFGSVATTFKTQEITGDILLELNTTTLKELDVPTFGKRFKLQTAIKFLKEECAQYSTNYLSKEYKTHSMKQPKRDEKKQGNEHKTDCLITASFTSNHPTVLPIEPSRHFDQEDCPEMQGWLYKQGCKYKTWNKRWFILKGPNLFYFKSPKDIRMKGVINLRGYRIIPDESIQPGKYSFKAQHEEERTFYFYTDQESSMKSWILNLMKSTISRDYTTPVLSSRVIPAVSLEVARRMRPRPPSVLLYESRKLPQKNLPEQDLVDQDSGFDSDRQPPPSIESDEDEGIEQDVTESQDYEDMVEWVNTACRSQIVSLKDLNQDILVELLEELSGKEISPTKDRIISAFEFMAQEGIPVVMEFDAKDFCQGNESKIMAMLQSIFEWSLQIE